MLPRKMPGVSKNAIDWLTRPPEDKSRIFGNLPVGLMGATLGSFGTARMVASIASIRSTGMVWETHVGKRRYELVR